MSYEGTPFEGEGYEFPTLPPYRTKAWFEAVDEFGRRCSQEKLLTLGKELVSLIDIIDETGIIDEWNEEYHCPFELLRDNLENARVSVASFITPEE